MRRMRAVILALWLASGLMAQPRFEVKFAPEARSSPADGRLIMVVSKDLEGEPRFDVSWGIETQQTFGVDVTEWKPGEAVRIDVSAVGHPLRSLRDLPPGTYNVQAVLNVYETFHRADGHVVKLHRDQGEGQKWNRSPGNLYSRPQRVEIHGDSVVAVTMTEVIPPITPPKDTKYIRHVRIESKLLTKFWSRPVYLGPK
jgi:hypothetical protein